MSLAAGGGKTATREAMERENKERDADKQPAGRIHDLFTVEC